MPLDANVVLHRDTVEEYVLSPVHSWSAGTRANRRSQLYRVAHAALGDDAVPMRLTPLPASGAVAPYTDAEVTALRWWARNVGGVWNPHSLTALITFGAGAGLSNEEILRVRGGDVTREDGLTLVAVRGDRARVVPVLARFEMDAHRLAQVVGPDRWVFRPLRTLEVDRKSLNNLVDRTWTPDSGVPRPTAQRLRVTWLVWHLRSRTPLRVLAEAAGVESLNALARYLHHVPGLDDAEARAYLRGDG